MDPYGLNKNDMAFKAISRAKLDEIEMNRDKPPNVGHYYPKFDSVEQ